MKAIRNANTLEELKALQVEVGQLAPLSAAGRLMGVSRTHGYRLAREGKLPLYSVLGEYVVPVSILEQRVEAQAMRAQLRSQRPVLPEPAPSVIDPESEAQPVEKVVIEERTKAQRQPLKRRTVLDRKTMDTHTSFQEPERKGGNVPHCLQDLAHLGPSAQILADLLKR